MYPITLQSFVSDRYRCQLRLFPFLHIKAESAIRYQYNLKLLDSINFYVWWLGNGDWELQEMDFWPEFLASSWGKEFVAGGLGGMAGVVSGYPLDTLRIRLQQPRVPGSVAAGRPPPSAFGLLRSIVSTEGVGALYRGMGAPLASVAFQVLSDIF